MNIFSFSLAEKSGTPLPFSLEKGDPRPHPLSHSSLFVRPLSPPISHYALDAEAEEEE
jgi:hypothetical protein